MALRRMPLPTRHKGELELVVFDSGGVRIKAPCGFHASGTRIEREDFETHTAVKLWKRNELVTSVTVKPYVAERAVVESQRSFE